MNIARMAVKELKQNIRNFKANIMMVLFPIVLIIILGAAFSGVFDSTIQLNDVTVLYTEETADGAQTLTKAFESFRDAIGEELGITFEKTDDVEMGIESMNYYQYSAYLFVSDSDQEIRLYKNERHGFTASLLESALNSFTNTYGVMATIAVNNPSAMAMLPAAEEGDYVRVRSLDEKRQPGSLDYYAVTMLTLILLYSSLTGLFSVKSDIEEKTASRVLCAPVRGYELLTGKVLGCISVTILQGLAVILFSKFILKAYWGEDLLTVALLLISYSIMAVSIGVGLGYAFKKSDAATGAINTLIPVLVFLGGGYVPLDTMGPAFAGISNISPVKWINSALFRVLYDNDYSHVAISLGINLAIAAVFVLLSAVLSGKGNGKYA